jgi:site-specific recombinase XerD
MPNINAHFKLKEPKSDEATLILLKSYFNSQRFVYSTKEFILPTLWDLESERPTTDKDKLDEAYKTNIEIRSELKDIRNQLNRLEDELEKAYSYLVKQKIPVTPKELKKLLDAEFDRIPVQQLVSKGFHERFDEYLKFVETSLAERTVKKFKTLQNILIDFETTVKYPLTFETIDLIFYDKFLKYLLTKKKKFKEKEKDKEKQKERNLHYLNDTINKYIRDLKTFLNWAYNRGYCKNDTFKHEDFKAIRRLRKNDIVVLKEDEFQKLLNFDLSKYPKLEKVRDVFCFATFVGQRWSDIERFRKEDVKEYDKEGKKEVWWVFTAYKTKKETKVPLVGWSEPALRILDKYNYELPIISQQKFNDYIKEAGEEAGIDEPERIIRYSGTKEIEDTRPKHEFMSSHMARRTCVTILLEKGVPPTTIMKLTGHTDLSTLMKYVETKSEALASEFERIGQIK